MKNNRCSPNSCCDLKLTLLERMEEHSAFHWLKQNWQYIAYGLAALFGLLILLYMWTSKSAAHTEKEYYSSYALFEHFSQQPTAESFSRVEQLLTVLPTLHSKYDGAIAQIWLSQDKPSEAESYTTATLQRVSKDGLPHYSEFAAISLLISKKDYSDALQRSLSLRENLSSSVDELLTAFNLIRIATLQQQLGYSAEAKQGWQEWQQYTQKHPKHTTDINDLFGIGSINLDEYIGAKYKGQQ